MRKLSQISACMITATLALPLMAQTVEVNTSPGVDIDFWSFNSETGVLSIDTTDPDLILTKPGDNGGGGGGNDEPVSVTVNPANPGTLSTDQNTSITWTAANATRCEYISGNRNWRNASDVTGNGIDEIGATRILAPAEGTFTYRVRCTGNEPTDIQTAGTDVTGTEPTTGGGGGGGGGGGSAACQDRPPVVSANPVERTWSAEFGESFPLPDYEPNARVIVAETTYKTISFNTGSAAGRGSLSLANPNTIQAPLAAISQCPGDFAVDEECRTIMSTTAAAALLWAMEGNSQENGRCVLQPGTTYYLNLAYGNTDFTKTEGQDYCSGTTCERMDIQLIYVP